MPSHPMDVETIAFFIDRSFTATALISTVVSVGMRYKPSVARAGGFFGKTSFHTLPISS